MGTKSLTPQNEKFCQAFIKSGEDKIISYKEAYDCGKLKPNAIFKRAQRLLEKEEISVRLEELRQQIKTVANVKFQINSETLLRDLDAIRTANLADYVTVKNAWITEKKTGKTPAKKRKIQKIVFKPVHELTREQQHCIEEIKLNKDGEIIGYKLFGKDWAIDKIGKHIDFFKMPEDQKKKIYDSPEAREARIAELRKKLEQG